jgi:hypothetical protein
MADTSNEQKLYNAIKHQDLEEIKRLVQITPINVNFKPEENTTILDVANRAIDDIIDDQMYHTSYDYISYDDYMKCIGDDNQTIEEVDRTKFSHELLEKCNKIIELQTELNNAHDIKRLLISKQAKTHEELGEGEGRRKNKRKTRKSKTKRRRKNKRKTRKSKTKRRRKNKRKPRK